MKNYYIKYVCNVRIKYLFFFSRQVCVYSVSCGENNPPYFYGEKQICWDEANFKAEFFDVGVIFI